MAPHRASLRPNDRRQRGLLHLATLIADLPVYNSEELYLTKVLLTQELTDAFSVFAGKMDTLDGDMNAFAHGRGKTQFSNMGFVFNPIAGVRALVSF